MMDQIQQRKPSRTLPEHWRKRFEDPTPLSNREYFQFDFAAGPDFDDWVNQIERGGEDLKAEAEAMRRELLVLKAAGYFDETGRPRPELNKQFFDGFQLKPEWLEKCRNLKLED